jgi:lipopolysaccharide/colanic/teichoic acid biosynthesis glycosyltransferase
VRIDSKPAKRLFDIFASSTGLLLLIPAFFIIAYRIRAEDGGPVFYRGVRVGVNKTAFKIFKFRTMVTNAEKLGAISTSEDDIRITPTGKFLRKYKLDELPQLINVLIGDMSIVGPRPEVPSEVGTYGPEWDVIFSIRPGITDLSSIEFYNEGAIIADSGMNDPHEAYRTLIQPRKLELQKEYAAYASLGQDIRIIYNTMKAMLRFR